jgi:mitogen-activated protein kinase kinase
VVRITGEQVNGSLKKDIDERPSPEQIMNHPWVLGIQKLNVDMERWIKEAWGWKN